MGKKSKGTAREDSSLAAAGSTAGQLEQEPPTTAAAPGGSSAGQVPAEELSVVMEFEENELALARDNGYIYDVKVLRVQEATENTPKQYFVHFVGWNAKWDKWSDGRELLKVTEDNRKLQKELLTKKKRGGEKKGDGGGKRADDGSKRRKTGIDMDIDEDSPEPHVKVNMPFTLKKQLVDDWEMITREPYHLVPLPRVPPAAAILSMYIEQKREKNSTSSLQLQRFQELMEGIRLYFDKALPLILLYRQEREQYERVKAEALQKDGKTFMPSEVYGAEHLLRLFVRLPVLLSQASMTPQEVMQVQSKLGDFLKFLQRNHGTFFLANYILKSQPLMPIDQNGQKEAASAKAGVDVVKGAASTAAE